ncbi:MAG: asparagine synthase (glutamine-hydrolyzing) [Flavobacterium sp.]|nr:asparagine synthase (glutamine-hydrolyzing) [Flavobacterium sp.]
MCGIYGEVSKKVASQLENLEAGLNTLSHRGPDASGSWLSPDGMVWLGHRRLSIIDLSNASVQPMHSFDSRFSISFNGEIYNFQQVKDQLLAKGYKFNSTGDTEVLLNAWHCWGVDCLKRIDGMFAFAIYDANAQKLFLARDRAGEKPLYYKVWNSGISFASELKPLLNRTDAEKNVNPLALNSILGLGYVPRDLCIIEGHNKLLPGHFLEYDIVTSKHTIKEYWCLPNQEIGKYSEEELIEELDRLMSRSISEMLVADVPVGVLLSGGLDSSLITSYASKAKSDIHTFTVGFEGFEANDEKKHAKLIADSFGTKHIELDAGIVKPELLNDLAVQFDEPIADPALIPTYLISKLVKEYCTVALAGEGGDELFGGYARYTQMIKMKEKFNGFPLGVRKLVSSAAENILPIGFKGRHYLMNIGTDFSNSIPLSDSLFNYKERKKLLQSKYKVFSTDSIKQNIFKKGSDFADTLFRYDMNSFLPENLLLKADRSSMLASLELRTPFLDRKIIEFAFKYVPTSLKVDGNRKKILLKMLGKQVLPSSFDFSRKQGFIPPLDQWFQMQNWKSFIMDNLTNSNAIFDQKMVNSMYKGMKEGHYNKRRIFILLMLQLWSNNYKINM